LPVILRDEDAALRARWVVVSRRSAYWKPALRRRLEQGRRVAVRERQGVWLSGLWTFSPETNPTSDASPPTPRR
ncbi:4-amino-4-deoxy-L-arabinose transferase, partial [Singulisphaera rosea]